VSGESNTNDSAKSDARLARLVRALPGLNVGDAVARLGGSIVYYKELLEDLCNSLEVALSSLRPLIQSGGIKEALIRLHGLRGMSANLGAVSLIQVFEKMEQALSTSSERQYETLITRMEQTIQQNITIIDAFLHSEEPSPVDAPPPDGANEDLLAEKMKYLARLLDQKRLDAIDAFKQLSPLMHHWHTHPEFHNLASAMGRLDYADARKALTALADSMKIALKLKKKRGRSIKKQGESP
jgi:HPt (histidine-containing phosphotransfer) domain-containing protein